MLRRPVAGTLPALAAVLAIGCGGSGSPTTPTATATPTVPVATTPASGVEAPRPVVVPPATMLAVGDIGMCGYREVAMTADLVDGMPGVLALLGDLAYPNGRMRDFLECFHPAWGRHVHRSRPVPGNHEYYSENPTAQPYFDYFGAKAGVPGEGYYTYEAGEWLVLALNSNVPTGEGSPQVQWVRSVLATSRQRCAIAYWHHPRFSSGRSGDNGFMKTMWSVLDEAGVDVVLAGHDHSYERMAPQDADGRSHPQGMRQFVVGTGGAYLYEFPNVKANSEVRGVAHGVLRLTLRSDAYDWEFVPIPGQAFSDSGTGQCS